MTATAALRRVVAALDHADTMFEEDGTDRPRVTEHDYPRRVAALRTEAGAAGDAALVANIDAAPAAPDREELDAARRPTNVIRDLKEVTSR